MPYFAEPFTFEGTSTRGVSLPIRRNCAGFFRSASLELRWLGRHGGELHHLAVGDAPAGLRRAPPRSARCCSSSSGTFHCRATLSISTRRAWAPPMRSGIQIAGHRQAAGVEHRAVEQTMVVAVDLRVGRRVLRRHLGPVRVELLRQDERQRGEHALPHLGGRASSPSRCRRRAIDTQALNVALGDCAMALDTLPAKVNENVSAPVVCRKPRRLIFVSRSMATPPSRRAGWRARCADRCRSGRCCRSCDSRSARASASCSWPAAPPPA